MKRSNRTWLAARLAWRLARVGGHLISGLLQCALLFPWLPLKQRNERIQRWSAGLIRIFGIALEVSGPSQGGGALVANHVSWIDVFVLNAVAPCRFVAKSEVRRWPIVGSLSTRAGTLYLERARRVDLIRTNAAIADHLQQGERLAVFPEGTSARQGEMQAFHANIFQGIVAAQARVLPVAMAYFDADGKPSPAADYADDMSLWQSILSLLTAGPLVAVVSFLPVLDASQSDRRSLAAATHAAVAARLEMLLKRV